MPETIVKKWLDKLDIPVSPTLLTQQLKSHPDYPSLLSITDTLDYFGITNTAVQVEKEVLPEIDMPFLAHVNDNEDGFVICSNGASVEKEHSGFFSGWSGAVVMAEKPSGWKNALNTETLKKEKGKSRAQFLFIGAAITIAVAAACTVSGWIFTSLLMLAAAGIFVSWMIVSKDLGIKSTIADRVCGKENECTAVLQSKGAKLLPGISLGDVSLVWFSGLLTALCIAAFTGTAEGIVSVVSFLALASVPVIVYSLYYQGLVAKKWCRLCLIIAGLLLAQLSLVLPVLTGKGGWPIQLNDILLFTSALFAAGICWLSFKHLLKERNVLLEDSYAAARFKRNESVVSAILEKQRSVDITPFEKDLFMGNRVSPVQIMVVCNPYCKPCAKTHQALHEMLQNNEESFGLTVRFTVNSGEEDRITKTVQHIFRYIDEHTGNMAAKQKAATAQQVLHDWFSVMDYEKFAEWYPVSNQTDVTGILRQQEEWYKRTGINYTPTIFMNGYDLPLLYSANDIAGILSAIPAISQQSFKVKQKEFV